MEFTNAAPTAKLSQTGSKKGWQAMPYSTNVNIGMFLVVLLGLLLAQPSPAEDSGLKGTTKVRIVGGMAGSKPKEKVTRVKFAVAPVIEGNPAYQMAVSVTSNDDGSYAVALPAGRYWIGPLAKARDPQNYMPGAVAVVEQFVVVQEHAWTLVDVLEIGNAP
jgi:hypothetical protein